MKSFVQTALASTLAALASVVHAAPPSVALSGVLGGKALLVVNGTPPKGVAAGESHAGVKVVAVSKDDATIEIAGVRQTIRLGESPVSVGSGSASRRVVLMADRQGHFVNNGLINGKRMVYMVDTGASFVAIGRTDAERMGLDYTKGQPVRMNTANGVGQAWRIRLDSLTIGDIQVSGVEAVVTSEPMPFVLLGNSFLSGFQMTRANDQMVLEKRN